jgi:hypothetical protein
MARTTPCNVQNHVETVQLYSDGYAEPGYQGQVVAVGNWNTVKAGDQENQFMPRLLKALERIGVECEWYDEWSRCEACGKLVRTQPDHMSWTPSYKVVDYEMFCKACASELEEDD